MPQNPNQPNQNQDPNKNKQPQGDQRQPQHQQPGVRKDDIGKEPMRNPGQKDDQGGSSDPDQRERKGQG